MLKKNELARRFVSLDVETMGLLPGVHPLLSIGMAMFERGELVATFTVNVAQAAAETVHPPTHDWWMSQSREAYFASTKDPVPRRVAAVMVKEWLGSVGGPTVVTWRAFDQWWVHHLLLAELGEATSMKHAVDLRSYLLGRFPWLEPDLKTEGVPPAIRGRDVGDHTALGDAIAQGRWLVRTIESEQR